MENRPKIDEAHRKELLKFLLAKTAAVRTGAKPAELLRIRHCYESVNSEGLRVCLYRSDIYGILGMDYAELKVGKGSSLVLFYNKGALAATLAERRNARWLSRLGYPCGAGAPSRVEAMLSRLAERTAECAMPHEVGLFVGYPLKDVAGFMANIPSTPVHRGAWKVYGDAKPSIERMRLYAKIEEDARRSIDKFGSVDDFIRMCSCRMAG